MMKAKIIVAVPNTWMQLSIIDILSLAREQYICVKSLSESYEKVKEYPGSILLIDIFGYEESYRDIITRLQKEDPYLGVICLISNDKLDYAHIFEEYGAFYLVEKEKADSMLFPVMMRAKEDQQKQLPTLNKKEVNLVEKEDGKFFDRKFGRRSFLKGTAAAVAIAGVAVASPGNTVVKALAVGDENTNIALEERIFSGACRGNCCGGCHLDLYVRDGKLVKTSFGQLPDKEYNKRICLKGLSHVQRVYDHGRLKYPLKRVGERGAGQWERISWDEAINTITDKWKELWNIYGKESIAVWSSSGNFGSINGQPTWFRNALGAGSINNATDMALIGWTAKALGVGLGYAANEFADVANAKCIIVWGSNITESWMQSWRFIADAKQKGAKLVVIDTTFTTTASKADKFISVRPGSDAALALAMINVAIEEDLIDKEFIKKSTVGPLLVKERDGKYLRLSDIEGSGSPSNSGTAVEDPFIVWDSDNNTFGNLNDVVNPAITGSYEVNGIKVTTAYELLANRSSEYPPEKAQEICDVPADTIRELLHIYVKNTPSTILMGFGLDHYTNGHYNIMAVMALAMVTGNLGKAGASCGLSMPLEAFWANNALAMPEGAVVGQNLSIIELPKGLETGKIGNRPINLKSMYIFAGNPIGNHTERQKNLTDIVDKMELIVVAEMTMTDTAQYADIILPAAHWFEVDDIFGAYAPQPYIMLQEKALEPLYECKSDFEIFQLLARKMGVAKEYQNITALEYMNMLLDSRGAKAWGISVEQMQRDKITRVLPKFYIHGAGGVFPTATGRAQFYLESPSVAYDHGQEWDVEKERLPVLFEPPSEAWHENPLYEKYPLFCVQEHTKWRVHTQWSHCSWLRELDTEPIVKINPTDAKSRGITDGDIVKVFNDRGYVVLKAVIQNGIRAGVINIPKGWQRGQFIEGHYNDITAKVSNPVCHNSPFKDMLVNIIKM